MRARTSRGSAGRPPRPRCLESQVQYIRKPTRCHRNTVSGWTTARDRDQPSHSRLKGSRVADGEPGSPAPGRGGAAMRTGALGGAPRGGEAWGRDLQQQTLKRQWIPLGRSIGEPQVDGGCAVKRIELTTE